LIKLECPVLIAPDWGVLIRSEWGVLEKSDYPVLITPEYSLMLRIFFHGGGNIKFFVWFFFLHALYLHSQYKPPTQILAAITANNPNHTVNSGCSDNKMEESQKSELSLETISACYQLNRYYTPIGCFYLVFQIPDHLFRQNRLAEHRYFDLDYPMGYPQLISNRGRDRQSARSSHLQNK